MKFTDLNPFKRNSIEFATKSPPPVQPLAPQAGAALPARKVQTGTSYTAKGSSAAQTDQIQQPDLNQESGSAQPIRLIEVVPELVSPYSRAVMYDRMTKDSGVNVSMRVMKTPVLGAEFYVDPCSADPQDQVIADFVWANLAQGMSAPLLNSLEDILRMFEDGYSVLEKVHENREWTATGAGRNTKIYTMLKKLAVRPATTIKSIDYDDNGGPTQVTQSAIRADKSTEEVTIPISKSLIFTFSRNGGDLSGNSLLRSAYPHWYYKTHLYKVDAIAKERLGIGIPRGKLLPGYNEQDRRILRQLLKNLRTNEESFIIQTPMVEIDFVEMTGRETVNVLESADHHNMQIMLNVMAAFIALGTGLGSGGSRAVGATQSDMFMKSVRYVANYISDVINMYVIPELVVWNFPTRNFPQLKVRNIGETRDLQMMASAFANLVAQGAITADLPTEQWLRSVFDMPSRQPNEPAYNPPTKEVITEQETPTTPAKPTNGAANKNKAQEAVTAATTATPQKGNVKIKPGDAGNSGKPPSAAE